jgi:hypothetical protein
MFSIATTRFTTKTLLEKDAWCKKNGWTGSIYGTPIKISQNIPYDSLLFVLEMNNDINKIVGIGLVKNTLVLDKYYKIYVDGNYNRYIYKSLYRIDSDDSQLTEYEKKVIDIFNVLLFKGVRNVKRYQGITALPKWIADSKHMDFTQFFRDLFSSRFTSRQISSHHQPFD